MLSLQFPSPQIFPSPQTDGYESDEPTPAQRIRWAVAEAEMRSKQSAYAAQGRDQSGVLMWHAPNCRGICCQAEQVSKGLFGRQAMSDYVRFRDGESLWSIHSADMLVIEAAEAELYRATRVVREAEAAAAEAAYRMKTAAEIVAIQAHRGLKRNEEVQKKPTPCSRLYSCVGDKSSGGAKPTTRHVSSECWSHEYKCPKTGKLIAKHVCPWLHPGEAGWQTQWDTDRMWKPAAAPTRTWEPENRFAAAAQKRR